MTNGMAMGTGAGLDADVLIIGAGPVGLTLANTLGVAGVRVLVVEKLAQIIDYPRAIGIDDEALRTLQTAGLADEVQAHITPRHAMRFYTGDDQCFASIEPNTDEFGWSRRNAFIQPHVDNILFKGLARFPHVRALFERELVDFSQDDGDVRVTLNAPGDRQEVFRARYMVACDGGHSLVRRQLEVPFEGRTKPNQWIVVDVRNDPLGTPHVGLYCDPQRPFVSGALPHGVRRFEFLVKPGETEEELSRPENLARLLGRVVKGDLSKLDYIRQRVYTHNARLAASFRQGRILLAGDAAHIMPVWQGQGYNSGMRDASNLAWKLALVAQGRADAALLDSYNEERRDHARSMIHLSEVAGDIVRPTSFSSWLVHMMMVRFSVMPSVRRYFSEMRFKPMPRYESGVVVHHTDPVNRGIKLLPRWMIGGRAGNSPLTRLLGLMAEKRESLLGRLVHGWKAPASTPVGRMFIQPRMRTMDGQVVRLDDAIGLRFAILAWGTDPTWGMGEETLVFWRRLDARFIRVLPSGQLSQPAPAREDVVTLGDEQDRVKDWFGAQQDKSIVFLRPDRFVAALALPLEMDAVSRALAARLHAGM